MENPYVGPKPFDAKDERFFYGREVEVVELTSLVQAHQVVLLYSMSGAGKTSLLKAKLVTELVRAGETVLSSSDGADPLVRTSGPQPSGPDMFVRNILGCLGREALEYRSLNECVMHLGDRQTPKGLPALQVMILDQLEEVFTLTPDRWNARRRLFEDLSHTLEANPKFRVLLAIREEFVAGMEPYADYFPESLKTRYRLERLDVEAAEDAIRFPVEKNGLGKYSNDAVAYIVDELRKISQSPTGDPDLDHDEFVEPIFLQLGLATMWPSVAGRDEIDLEAVRTHFNLEGALEGHFSSAVAAIMDDDSPVKSAIQRHGITEAKLRLWFENELLTGSRRELVERGGSESAGMPNEVVDYLSKRYVLRSEPRIGKTFVELTHDRFVRAVLDSNAAWRQAQKWDVDLVALEQRARSYAAHPRGTRLMREDEIDELTQFIAAKPEVSAQISDALTRYLAASQLAARDRRLRTFRAGVFVLGFLLIAAVALGVASGLGWAQSSKTAANLHKAYGEIQENAAELEQQDLSLAAQNKRLANAKAVIGQKTLALEADQAKLLKYLAATKRAKEEAVKQKVLAEANERQARTSARQARKSAEKAVASERSASTRLIQLFASHDRVLQSAFSSIDPLVGLDEVLSSGPHPGLRLPAFQQTDIAWLRKFIGLFGATLSFKGELETDEFWPRYCYSPSANSLVLSLRSKWRICALGPGTTRDRENDVKSFRQSPDGRFTIIWGKGGIDLFDTGTGTEPAGIHEGLLGAGGAMVSADGSYVLSEPPSSGKVRLVHIGVSSAPVDIPGTNYDLPMSGAFAVSDGGGLSIRSSADGREIGRAKSVAGLGSSEVLSPAGQRYAWLPPGGAKLYVESTTDHSAWEQTTGDKVSQIWWASDQIIRCCSDQGRVLAWNVEAKRLVQDTAALAPNSARVDVRRDAWGGMVYLSWNQGTDRYCANVDLQTGRRNGPVRCPVAGSSVELSSDGKYLFIRRDAGPGVFVLNVAAQRALDLELPGLSSKDILQRAWQLKNQWSGDNVEMDRSSR